MSDIVLYYVSKDYDECVNDYNTVWVAVGRLGIVSMCITSGIMLLKTMRRWWREMLLKKPYRRRKKNISD